MALVTVIVPKDTEKKASLTYGDWYLKMIYK